MFEFLFSSFSFLLSIAKIKTKSRRFFGRVFFLLKIPVTKQNGIQPQHFSAWVWQIARNRYCLWANRKHRRAEFETGDSLDTYEMEDDGQRPDEQLIRTEGLAVLRRELAFIRGDYRDIVVAHYIDGKSLLEIAAELALPESTVKQRLYRARNLFRTNPAIGAFLTLP